MPSLLRYLFSATYSASLWSSRHAATIAFFGTPDASVLHKLVHACHPSFEVTTVITKSSGVGSQNKVLPMAKSLRASSRIKHVLTPPNAKDPDFIHTMASLNHDLYVTAAIGLILPQSLLDLPRLGVVNIHPSILPRWRGASPVQRCLEAGDATTGVSLTYTVLKCDAGPVLETTLVPLRGDENGVILLRDLLKLGGDRLLARMDDITSGKGRSLSVDQDESLASYAHKIKKEESRLDVRSLLAQEAHNKVRAFTGWLGTFLPLSLQDVRDPGSTVKLVDVDVISSRVESGEGLPEAVRVNRERVHYVNGRVLVPCREGMLEVLKTRERMNGRVIPVRDFMASLGKHCRLSLP